MRIIKTLEAVPFGSVSREHIRFVVEKGYSLKFSFVTKTRLLRIPHTLRSNAIL
jgi:hypothetical protein